jgi:hypothetical protein
VGIAKQLSFHSDVHVCVGGGGVEGSHKTLCNFFNSLQGGEQEEDDDMVVATEVEVEYHGVHTLFFVTYFKLVDVLYIL